MFTFGWFGLLDTRSINVRLVGDSNATSYYLSLRALSNFTFFYSQQLGLFVDTADHMGSLISVDGLSNPEIQVA